MKQGGKLAACVKTLQKATVRFCGLDAKRGLFFACAALLVAARLGIAALQRVYLTPGGSPLDDGLMLAAAEQIMDGSWLGPYTGLAIAKNMGFALWLAALHALHVPYLVGNAALWAAACLFAVWALRPVFPGRAARLFVLAFLLFCPVSFAQFTMRAYRDSVFPSFCMLLFAGAAGFVLRLPQAGKSGAVLCALAAGAGLGGAWLLREDGAVLLPYAIGVFGLAALFCVLRKDMPKRAAKAFSAAAPFALLAACVLAFSAANNAYYGVFRVNDLTGGSFPEAYGRMAAVSRAESGYTGRTPVTREALDKLMEASPSLRKLEANLISGPAFNGFANSNTGEFLGSFYYSLRLAAQTSGLTPTGEAAEAYWAAVSDEIRMGVAARQLASVRPGSSTVPRWSAELLGPVAAETGKGFLHLLTFQECSPWPPHSEGDSAEVARQAAFLHSKVQTGFAEGTDDVFYNTPQKIVFTVCNVLAWVYRIAIWPLLFLGVLGTGAGLWRGVRKSVSRRRFSFGLLAAVASAGLFLSVLLRLFVAAYMEVAAFHIGTYLMYLSSAAPALLLFCALGAPLVENSLSGPAKEKHS